MLADVCRAEVQVVDLLQCGKKISHTCLQLPEDDLAASLVTFSSDLELVFIGSYIFRTRVAQKALSLPLPLLEAELEDRCPSCSFSRCGQFFAMAARETVALLLFKIDVQRLSHQLCQISDFIDPTAFCLQVAFHPRLCQLVLCSVIFDGHGPRINCRLLDIEASPVRAVTTLEKPLSEGSLSRGKYNLLASFVN
jgi:hypothetical protein